MDKGNINRLRASIATPMFNGRHANWQTDNKQPKASNMKARTTGSALPLNPAYNKHAKTVQDNTINLTGAMNNCPPIRVLSLPVLFSKAALCGGLNRLKTRNLKIARMFPNALAAIARVSTMGLMISRQTPAIIDKCMPEMLNKCPVPVRCNCSQSVSVNSVLLPSNKANHHL